MLSDAAIGSNVDCHINIIGIDLLDLRRRDASVIKQHFLRVGKTSTGEAQFVLATNDHAAGQN